MLVTAVWLHLLLLALIVWAAFVRLNSYFVTPSLRWLFSLTTWLALVGLVLACAYIEKLPLGAEQLQPAKEYLDILTGDRVGIAVHYAAALLTLMPICLAIGLSRRTDSTGNLVPRARAWRWSVLIALAVISATTCWGETKLAEQSLRSQAEALGEDARSKLESPQLHAVPVAEPENAAVFYLRALDTPASGVPYHDRWDKEHRFGWNGEEWLPLNQEEEQTATTVIVGSRLRHCSFGQVKSDRRAGIHMLREFSNLLQRRIVTSEDPKTICESLIAIRNLSTHLCCDPAIRDVWSYSEQDLLDCVADIASCCPERLAAIDRKELLRDDADAVLAGMDADAIRIEAWNAETMSRLFERPSDWDPSAFSLRLRCSRESTFDETAAGLRRYLMRVRRVDEGNRMLELYRDRIDRFRAIVASAKARGRAEWTTWRDFRRLPRGQATWDDHADAALQSMLESAYLRFSFVSVRRVTNTALAAALFRQDRGRLPERLDELVPEYLSDVPVDLTTGKTLGWKSTNDSLIIFAADEPEGGSRGLEFVDGVDHSQNHVDSAVRIPARLPAGKASAKLPNP